MGSSVEWPKAKARLVVLVVEDEPLQRMMAVDLVEGAGFEALPVANAEQAIGILERRSDVRIVFTDIDLQRGMNGMRLAALIRDRWPPIEFIVTSGHMDGATLDLPPRSRFFSKPYRREDIVGALHGFLA
jgi:CheY-like chemotaxis protein